MLETKSGDTKIYIYKHIYIYIYNFTGVQASGVIIVYCDSAVSYGPKIIGPHSSVIDIDNISIIDIDNQ